MHIFYNYLVLKFSIGKVSKTTYANSSNIWLPSNSETNFLRSLKCLLFLSSLLSIGEVFSIESIKSFIE